MVNCFNLNFSSRLDFSAERREVLKNIAAMSSGFLDSDEELDNDALHQSEKLGEPYEVSKSSAEPTSKDDRTKPKRPLSAYNWFFQTERQRILEETPTRKEGKPRRSHGKIGFADLARLIAAKWKSLSKEERASYDEKAVIDKQRYQREMKEWKEGQFAAMSQAASSSAVAYRSFLSDPVRATLSRQTSNLVGTAYSPAPRPDRQQADEMKMSNTGYDILPIEPYSLTDVFGAELTRRRHDAAPAPTEPPPQRSVQNMDSLASQLGDESTQLFLNLFRER
jgi:HMG-box domain